FIHERCRRLCRHSAGHHYWSGHGKCISVHTEKDHHASGDRGCLVPAGRRPIMPDSVVLLPLPIILLLGFMALVAGIMRGYSGFGGGLLIAPAYSLFLAPTDVVVLVMVLNLLTTVQLMPQVLRNVQWGPVFSLAVTAAFIGVPVGVAVLHRVDPVLMRRAIAAIVSVTAILLLLGWKYQGRRGRIQDGIVGF